MLKQQFLLLAEQIFYINNGGYINTVINNQTKLKIHFQIQPGNWNFGRQIRNGEKYHDDTVKVDDIPVPGDDIPVLGDDIPVPDDGRKVRGEEVRHNLQVLDGEEEVRHNLHLLCNKQHLNGHKCPNIH